MHKYGYLSAQYAECAAQQGKFWPFHDSLLARQGNWSRLADAAPAFERIAEEVGLNTQALETCLQAGKADAVIEKDKAEGKSHNIQSTPTYFVNGKMVVGKPSLDQELNKLLGESGH